jgi:hypothetical protein
MNWLKRLFGKKPVTPAPVTKTLFDIEMTFVGEHNKTRKVVHNNASEYELFQLNGNANDHVGGGAVLHMVLVGNETFFYAERVETLTAVKITKKKITV